MTELVTRRIRDVLPSVRKDLEDLIRIESVWADPGRRDEVHRSAHAVGESVHRCRFHDVQIVSEGGAPAVIARHPAPPGARTVMLYAHHDVQPEGDHSQWHSPPFQPTERDGRLYGRGSADDKAGIAAHLAAIRAFGGRPPVGVTVFVEGEEESGSPSLSRLLAAHQDELAADVIIIADSDNWSTEIPASDGVVARTGGLRGRGGHPRPWPAFRSLGRRGARCRVGIGPCTGQPCTMTRAMLRSRACMRASRPTWTFPRNAFARTRVCSTASAKSVPALLRNDFGQSRRSPSSVSTQLPSRVRRIP